MVGKLVIGGIDADSLEDLGVFSQAIRVEPALGEFATRNIFLSVVEMPALTGIFPRGRANEDALAGELGCRLLHSLAIERHGSFRPGA